MDFELLFADQKWNILKLISQKSASPIQIASVLDTSLANVSQQLRLLEMASLVKTERAHNRERGQPRKIFSLSDDFVYMITIANDFAEKKLLRLSGRHKAILKIWYMEDTTLHRPLERLYCSLEPVLGKIDAVAVMPGHGKCQVYIVADKKIAGIEPDEAIDMKVCTKKEILQLKSGLIVLHDPGRLLGR
ncbi:MAG: winged helix-turn-helix domain-containing protein [archaeon]